MTQLVLTGGEVPLDLKRPIYRYVLQPYVSEDHGHGELWICRTGRLDDRGAPYYRAILLWADRKLSAARVVFDDTSLAGWDVPDQVAAAALSFFCVRPGDVDANYFEKYKKHQILWRDEHAEATGLLAYAETDNGPDSLAHLLIPERNRT